jgi:hypothetical protein
MTFRPRQYNDYMAKLAMAGAGDAMTQRLQRVLLVDQIVNAKYRELLSTYGVTCLAMCDFNCTKLRNDYVHGRRCGQGASSTTHIDGNKHTAGGETAVVLSRGRYLSAGLSGNQQDYASYRLDWRDSRCSTSCATLCPGAELGGEIAQRGSSSSSGRARQGKAVTRETS